MRRRRLSGAAAGRIAAALSARDRAILTDVARVRVLTSRHIERLHFSDLVGKHRDRTRRRVLERLVELQVLTPLERRIGGVRAGSAGLVFALGPTGQRIILPTLISRVRQPTTPTERFLAHNLAVAGVYVDLAEAAAGQACQLVRFDAEPACWWRSTEGEWIKPDAVAVIAAADFEDCWAIEVDMATESLPTLRRKLMVYVDLARNEERLPGGGPLPRVLVTVPDAPRLSAVRGLVAGLPAPADQLFTVCLLDDAATCIAAALRE